MTYGLNLVQIRIEHRLATLAIFALMAVISPVRGVACTMGFAEHKVARSFVIGVSYNGRPLQGMEVEISRETDKEPYLVVVVSTKTNEKGQSSIKALAPGRYFLVVRHAGVEGEAVELRVVADEQADAFVEDELKLNWPNRKVFKVRQIAGTLIRTPFDYRIKSVEPPLAGSKLTVIDALPATQRGVSVTQNDGKFAFADLAAGLYILRVKEEKSTKPPRGLEEEIEGNIFVEVTSNAPDQEIPVLRVYMSDCGMGMRGKDGNEIF